MAEKAPNAEIEKAIDRLYQLPLEDFTAERNALAKTAGPDAAMVKGLQKPAIAAWAINQVYWRGRPAFHALTVATTALREAHTAALSGKRVDVRAAGQAHDAALEAVAKAALVILKDAGQPPTEATRQAITTTLRALPGSSDPPGRLTRVLQPTGFELLAGLPSVVGGSMSALKAAAKAVPEKVAAPTAPARGKDAAREKAFAKAKEDAASALRTERAAEQRAKRDEFEAARTARESERAERELEKARRALDAAQQAVADAERDLESSKRARDAAARQAKESATTLVAAKVKAETAQAEVSRLKSS